MPTPNAAGSGTEQLFPFLHQLIIPRTFHPENGWLSLQHSDFKEMWEFFYFSHCTKLLTWRTREFLSAANAYFQDLPPWPPPKKINCVAIFCVCNPIPPAKVCSWCYECNLLTVHIEPNTELIWIWCDTVEIRGTAQLTQAVNLAYYLQMNCLRLSLLNWEQILLCFALFGFFLAKVQSILIILAYYCDLVIWKWESYFYSTFLLIKE